MPTSIPYDPSLTLMSVVDETALNNLIDIAALQAPVDAAQDALNSLIASKRSLTLTKTELRNLGIPTDNLDKELDKLNAAVDRAAGDYAKAKMTAEPQIMQKRKIIRSIHKEIESPVDYSRSQIKNMPLANDSMNMDVQYFSFDTKSQSSATYSAQIASYVSGTVRGVFGVQKSMDIGTAASHQVSHQVSQHSIAGTLVLSVSCTHKNAAIMAPFVLNVDKAVKVWNHLFPSSKLDPTSGSSMMQVAMSESQEDKQKFSIVSGTTFGSIFVGMAHVLNTSDTSTSESMMAAAASMQDSMEAGSWFANQSGNVSLDSKFASDVKNLLSQQNVQSHATILTMGVDLSMTASEGSRIVEGLTKLDTESNMAAVISIQDVDVSDQASVQSSAEEARISGQASEMQDQNTEPVMSAVDIIGDSKNRVLDVSSMITALDDYLKKAAESVAGIPINYYLKEIDQKMLAQMWISKYFPGKFVSNQVR
ncbi:hypothetical protein FGRMN_6545 [Fusarium graminum]|nr:hypothetical protein FGRMN_6545 [Fusarium graminum]